MTKKRSVKKEVIGFVQGIFFLGFYLGVVTMGIGYWVNPLAGLLAAGVGVVVLMFFSDKMGNKVAEGVG